MTSNQGTMTDLKQLFDEARNAQTVHETWKDDMYEACDLELLENQQVELKSLMERLDAAREETGHDPVLLGDAKHAVGQAEEGFNETYFNMHLDDPENAKIRSLNSQRLDYVAGAMLAPDGNTHTYKANIRHLGHLSGLIRTMSERSESLPEGSKIMLQALRRFIWRDLNSVQKRIVDPARLTGTDDAASASAEADANTASELDDIERALQSIRAGWAPGATDRTFDKLCTDKSKLEELSDKSRSLPDMVPSNSNGQADATAMFLKVQDATRDVEDDWFETRPKVNAALAEIARKQHTLEDQLWPKTQLLPNEEDRPSILSAAMKSLAQTEPWLTDSKGSAQTKQAAIDRAYAAILDRRLRFMRDDSKAPSTLDQLFVAYRVPETAENGAKGNLKTIAAAYPELSDYFEGLRFTD